MITLRAVINSGLPLMTLSRTSAVNISQAHSLFSGWMLKAHILPLKDDVSNYSKRISRNVGIPPWVKWSLLASLGGWLVCRWLLNALLLVWHMNFIRVGFESHSLSKFLLDLMWCLTHESHSIKFNDIFWIEIQTVSFLPRILRVKESKPSASTLLKELGQATLKVFFSVVHILSFHLACSTSQFSHQKL